MITSLPELHERRLELARVEDGIAALRKALAESETDSPDFTDTHLGVLRQQERYRRHLRLAIRDFEISQQDGLQPAVISCQSLDGVPGGVARALRLSRLSAGFATQGSLAEVLKVNQSRISQLESPSKADYELSTIQEWSQATGFAVSMFFVNSMYGLNDPEAVYQFALEAIALKGKYRKHGDMILEAFMTLLQDALHADIATCFVGDRYSNRLVMAYQSGVSRPDSVDSIVRRDESPARFLGGDLECIPEVNDHPILKSSRFCKRERIRSVIAVPFSPDNECGIILLSYSRGAMHFSDDYVASLKILPHIASALLSSTDLLTTHSPIRLGTPQLAESHAIHPLIHVPSVEQKPSADDDMPGRTLLKDVQRRLGLPDATCLFYSRLPDSMGWDLAERLEGTPSFLPHPDLKEALNDVVLEDDFFVAEMTDSKTRYFLSLFECGTPLFGGKAGGAQSCLVLPVSCDGGTVADGALVIATAECNAFSKCKEYLIKSLSGIANAIARWQRTQVVIYRRLRQMRKGSDRKVDIEALMQQISSPPDGTGRYLASMAHLMRLIWSASSVAIWPYCWDTKSFALSSGVTSIDEEWRKSLKLSDDALQSEFWPRSDGSGVSERLVRDQARSMFYTRWADRDTDVAKQTKNLGISAVIGAPVFGSDALKSEGVIWVRFAERPKVDAFLRCVREIAAFAGYIHLLWNPMYYGVLDDKNLYQTPPAKECKNSSRHSSMT